MADNERSYSNPISARRAISARGVIDRHRRAAEAVDANGGRSAPQAAGSRPMGLSADWGTTFPEAPSPQINPRTGSPFMSAPPRISARDAAMNASPEPFMPSKTPMTVAAPITSETGSRATDAANLAQNMAMASNPRAFLSARGPSVPATVPSITLDPSLPPARVSSTGITRNMPSARASIAAAPTQAFNQTTARASLYQSNPAIFQAGTPENAAFVAFAKENGEEAAHANLAQILASTQSNAPSPV